MRKHCKSSCRPSRWDSIKNLLGFGAKQCDCGGRKKRSYSFEPLEERQLLAVCHWTNGVGDGQWGTQGNWAENRVPATNDDVYFTSLGIPTATNNNITGLSLHSVMITEPGYELAGNPISVTDSILVTLGSGTSTISFDVEATGTTTVNVGDNSRLWESGLLSLSSSGSLAKVGTGTMVLANPNSVQPTVQGGVLITGDADLAASVSVVGGTSVSEGSPYTLQLSSTATLRTSPDPWQIADWGDGASGSADGATAMLEHSYADGTQNLLISASVTDSNGDEATIKKAITVNNVAPQLKAFGDREINVGDYTLNLSAYDPGADTIANWTIDWRDGAAPSHEHLVSYAGNPSSVTHTYTTPGTYNIVATAFDEDGSYTVAGNAGKLDATFGVGGMVVVDASQIGDRDVGCAVGVQFDGKIVVASARNGGGPNLYLYLTRYLPKNSGTNGGTRDERFGGIGNGIVTINLGGSVVVSSLAIDSNDNIVVSGTVSGQAFALRYLADGTGFDPTFNPGGSSPGMLFGNFGGKSVAVLRDDKILVGGTSTITRLNVDGSVDATYSGVISSRAIAVQSDGRTVVASTVNERFRLTRYNSNGTLDTSFGSGGSVTPTFGGNYEEAYCVTVQPDGKILVAGITDNGANDSYDMAIARYTTGGQLDTTFGGGGKVKADFGNFDYAYGMAIQKDGCILVTGNGNNGNTALARYLPGNATVAVKQAVSTWTGQGRTPEWTNPANWAGNLAPLPGDRLIFSGTAPATADNDFAAGTTFASIEIDSNMTLTGETPVLTDGITVNQSVTVATVAWDVTASGSLATTLNVLGANATLRLTHTLSGAGGLTKTGPGAVSLAAIGTFTGVTTINGGALQCLVNDAIGTGNVSVCGAGAVLDLQGHNDSVGAVTLLGGSIIGKGVLTSASDTTVQAGTIDAVLNGSGGLTKIGAATDVAVVLDQNNFHGSTTINGGVLRYGTDNAINDGNVTVACGTLDMQTYSDSVGTVTLASGSIIGSGTLTGTGGFAVQSGAIGVVLDGGGLTKTGPGTVTLSNANHYTAATIVSAGVLTLGDGTHDGSVAGEIVDNASLVIDTDSDWTVLHTLTGSGHLTKTGLGTLRLAGGVGGSLLVDAVQAGAIIIADASVAPYISISGPTSVTEGAAYSLPLTNSVPIADWHIDWGDGTQTDAVTTHVYANAAAQRQIVATTTSNGTAVKVMVPVEVTVNHPPVVSDSSRSVSGGGTLAFTTSDFGTQFTDVDGDHLAAVTITSLPTSGRLLLSGHPIVAGTRITAGLLPYLAYTPGISPPSLDAFRWNGSDGRLFAGADAQLSIAIGANNAPVLNASFSPELDPVDGGNPLASLGNTVAQIVADGSITEVGGQTLVKAIAVTSVDSAHGEWQYRLEGQVAWQDYAASDTASLLLGPNDSLRFVPDGEFFGATMVTFRAWDQTDGRQAGEFGNTTVNGGHSAYSVSCDQASVWVTPRNVAPQLDADAQFTLGPIAEDGANPVGNTVAEIVPDNSVTEISGQAAVKAIAVISVADDDGKWQYKLSGASTWVDLTASGDASLLLEPTDRVRFVPNVHFVGSATFDFRAWDESDGRTHGQVVDTSGEHNGNSTAFSAEIGTAQVSVNGVNHAPALASGSPTLSRIAVNGVDSVGNLVGEIVVDGSITDADVTEGVPEAIAVSFVDDAHGTWEYRSADAEEWMTIAASPSSALLLNADDCIRFVPTADYTGSATFRFRAWDQTSLATDAAENGGSSAFSDSEETATISVQGNDAPVLADVAYQLYPVDEGIVAADDQGNTVTEIVDGAITEVTGQMVVDAMAVTSIDNAGGKWQYCLADETEWIEVAVTSGDGLLLGPSDSLRFLPNADFHGVATFGFRAWDQSDGLSAGETVEITATGGSTPFSAVEGTAQLTINELHDAPILGDSVVSALTPIVEDIAAVDNPGASVGSIVPDGAVVDVFGNPLNKAIAVTEVDNANGVWQYRLAEDGTWQNVTASDDQALLLGPTDYLRFLPNADYFGTAHLVFHAWDGSDGKLAGNTADTTENGGATAFSAVADTATVTVQGVNDAPLIGNVSGAQLTAIMEDTERPIGNSVSKIVLGELLSDAYGEPMSASIAVPSVDNAHGVWQYRLATGGGWNAIAATPAAALLLGPSDLIRFIPNANYFGTATFTFRAWDGSDGKTPGQTADTRTSGGETAFSAALGTATIEVIGVDDAPLLDSAVAVTLPAIVEDTAADNIPGAKIGDIVPDDSITKLSEPQAVKAIAITAVDDSHGTWQYQLTSGGTWSDIVATSIAAFLLDATASIRFVPNADYFGTVGFAFRAWDSSDGRTAGDTADTTINGHDSSFSAAAVVATIDISNVNDPPALADAAPAFAAIPKDVYSLDNPGETVAAMVADGSVTDRDVAVATEAIAVTAVDGDHGVWQFSLFDADSESYGNWTPISVSSDNALLLGPSDKIRFMPSLGYVGTATLTFRAWDRTDGQAAGSVLETIAGNTAISTSSDTATITVNAANDKPVRTGTLLDLAVSGATGSKLLGLNSAQYSAGLDPSEASQSLTFTVTAIPDANLGSVYKSDTAVTVGTTYTLTEMAEFVFEWNAPTVATDTFTFSVTDNGVPAATLNESIDITWTQATPPELADSIRDLSSEGQATFDWDDFQSRFSDTDGDSMLSVKITALPASGHGALTRNGVAVAIGDVFGASDLEDVPLVYSAGVDSGRVESFKWKASDDSGVTDNSNWSTLGSTVWLQKAAGPYVDDLLKQGYSEDQTVQLYENDFSNSVRTPTGDSDSNFLTVAQITTLPEHGTLRLSGTAVVLNESIAVAALSGLTYTPEHNYNGYDRFSWLASNGASSLPGKVIIQMNPVNDAYVGATQTVYTVDRAAIVIDLGGDGDPESTSDIHVHVSPMPTHGTLEGIDPTTGYGTISYTGQITYTPNRDAVFGSDSFSYTLIDDDPLNSATATVTISDQPLPVANAPTSPAAVDEDPESPLALTLTGSDPWGRTPTYAIEEQPLHGTLTGPNPSTGAVSYTPDKDYNGPDEFSFTVSCVGENGTTLVSSPAVVSITVTPRNDAPVNDAVDGNNQFTVTVDDSPLWIALGRDGDPESSDALVLTVTQGPEGPAHGVLSDYDPATGLVLYTRNGDSATSDSFKYTLTDADGAVSPEYTAVITVDALPVAHMAANITTNEDTAVVIPLSATVGSLASGWTLKEFRIVSDPNYGTLSGIDPLTNEITYTPNENYNGQDSFSFVATYTDASGTETRTSAPGEVDIDVTPANDVPQAIIHTVVTRPDQPVTFVLGNDGDGDVAQLLTWQTADGQCPTKGTLSDFDPVTGEITYTPNPGQTGPDSFAFTLTDSDALTGGSRTSAPVTVYVAIAPSPTAGPISRSIEEDNAVVLTLHGDDGDSSTVRTLLYQIDSPPQHGTLGDIDQGTGEVSYQPEANYHGVDKFSYRVYFEDSQGTIVASDAANVEVTIAAVNDAPVAADQSINILRASPTGLSLGGDGDPEVAQTLYLTVTSAPLHGTLSGYDLISGEITGQITYTPDVAFVGTDSFTFTLTDDSSAGSPASLVSASATVAITVSPAPAGVPQLIDVVEDQPVEITLAADAITMAQYEHITYSIAQGPAHGTLGPIDHVTGKIQYTPAADYNGPDHFTYNVSCDGGLTSSPVTIDVDVAAVNDAPSATPQRLTVAKDQPAVISLGDDGDLDLSQQLVATLLQEPQHGTLLDFDPSTGNVTYLPDPGYMGADTFSFQLTDLAEDGSPLLTSDVATVTIFVKTPPQAGCSSVSVDEDTPLNVTLVGTKGENGTLTYDIVKFPQHGIIDDFDPSTGKLTYTPDDGYFGEDSFGYVVIEQGDDWQLQSEPATITVDVASQNHAPVADDQAIGVEQGQSVIVFLTGDDGDDSVDQALTFEIVSQPTFGHLSLIDSKTGQVTYTPGATFESSDTFTFRVNDGTQNSTVATVTITMGLAPVATAQSVTTDEGGTVALTLEGHGETPARDPRLTYFIVTPPKHGDVVDFDPLTGHATYAPDADYNGDDSFTFAVVDDNAATGLSVVSSPAVVLITVAPKNGAPVSHSQDITLSEDGRVLLPNLGDDGDLELDQTLYLVLNSSPAHGTLSGFDTSTGEIMGELVYTPQAGYTGPDSFMFALADGPAGNGDRLLSEPATITLHVTETNHRPTAQPEAATVAENGTVSLALHGDDGDLGHTQTVTYAIVTPPSHGVLGNFDPATGTLSYSPDADYSGDDSFCFVVIDDNTINGVPAMTSEAADFSLTVTAVNHAPTARNESVTTQENQNLSLYLYGDGGDPDSNETLTYTLVQPISAVEGTASLDPTTGELTLAPAQNFRGAISLQYVVTDGDGAVSAPATVTISVQEVAWNAVAQDQVVTTQKNQAVTVVLTTAGNWDTVQNLSFTAGNASDGTLGTVAGNTVTFTPTFDFVGVATFTFQVTDLNHSTTVPTEATVTIYVNDCSSSPVANYDYATFRLSDGNALLDVMANDTAAVGESLDIVNVTQPTNGVVTIVPATPGESGSAARDRLLFVPQGDYTGGVTFYYTIEDSQHHQSIGMVELTILAGVSAPIDGSVSIGGVNFDPQAGQVFVPPISGNATLTRFSQTNFSQTWIDPLGGSHTSDGIQTTTATVTTAGFSGGNWTYSETVTWSYDVASNGVHRWGGYVYTFGAMHLGGMTLFSYSLKADDLYSVTLLSCAGSATGGESGVYQADGHDDASVFIYGIGDSVIGRYSDIGMQSASYAGTYWYPSVGGVVKGTTSSSSSALDTLVVDVSWAVLPSGDWTVSGTLVGVGFGGGHSGYDGNGTYRSGGIAGRIDEGGLGNESSHYMLFGTLSSVSNGWNVTGNGSCSGDTSAHQSYQGSGTLPDTGCDGGRSWSGRVDAKESGSTRDKTTYNVNVALGASGWQAISGTSHEDGDLYSAYSYSSSGTYTSKSTAENSSFAMSGTTEGHGGSHDCRHQTIDSVFNGVGWGAAGTASATGESYSFSSYSGSGDFTNKILGGTVSGPRHENGDNAQERNYQTNSYLGAQGWVTAGSASGEASATAHVDYSGSGTYSRSSKEGDYSGSGSYTTDCMVGQASQSGSEDTITHQYPEWTMPAGGQWALTGGSGSGSTDTQTDSSYTGDGVKQVVVKSGKENDPKADFSCSRKTIQQSESGSNHVESHATTGMSVVNNRWVTTSGSGSGSGSTTSDKSAEIIKGTYSSRNSGATVNGTMSGSGHTHNQVDFHTDSTYVYADLNDDGLPDGWAMSGSSSGSNSYDSDLTSSGGGKYLKLDDGGADSSESSGDVTERHSEWDTGSSSWGMVLDSQQNWKLTSGSGSSSGGNSNDFGLDASGTYSRKGHSIEGITHYLNKKHDESEWIAGSQVVDNAWKTASGSGSGSGFTIERKSASGGGMIHVDNDWGHGVETHVTEKGSDNSSFTYHTTSNVRADGKWHTTGSASSTEDGSTYYKQAVDANQRYERVIPRGKVKGRFAVDSISESNYDFQGSHISDSDKKNGDWVLSSGSGTSYAATGSGESYSGSGTYCAFGVSPFMYIGSGKITEHGSKDVLDGQRVTYGVKDGDWRQTKTQDLWVAEDSTCFDDVASGDYSHDSISGSFSRVRHVDDASHYEYGVPDKDGVVPTVGSGWETWNNSDTFSYSGEGSYNYGKCPGTFKEYYSDSAGKSGRVDGQTDANGFHARTGTNTSFENVRIESHFDGSRNYHDDYADLFAGTETVDGVEELKTDDVYTYSNVKTERFSNDRWNVVVGLEVTKNHAHLNQSYSGDGSYTALGASGSVHRDGVYDDTLDSTLTVLNLLGWSVKTGDGKDVTNTISNYSYDGGGDYIRGDISGHLDEDGWSSTTSHAERTYKLFNDQWKVRGTGTSTSDGGWNYSYEGDGEYDSIVSPAPAVPQRPTIGSQSESGEGNGTYSYTAGWKLGDDFQWALMSGSGTDKGTFHDLSHASADCQYVINNAYYCTTTVTCDWASDSNYSMVAKVKDHGWVTTASGRSTESGSATNEFVADHWRHVFYDWSSPSWDEWQEELYNGSQTGSYQTSYSATLDWSSGPNGTFWVRTKTQSASASECAQEHAFWQDDDGFYCGGDGGCLQWRTEDMTETAEFNVTIRNFSGGVGNAQVVAIGSVAGDFSWEGHNTFCGFIAFVGVGDEGGGSYIWRDHRGEGLAPATIDVPPFCLSTISWDTIRTEYSEVVEGMWPPPSSGTYQGQFGTGTFADPSYWGYNPYSRCITAWDPSGTYTSGVVLQVSDWAVQLGGGVGPSGDPLANGPWYNVPTSEVLASYGPGGADLSGQLWTVGGGPAPSFQQCVQAKLPPDREPGNPYSSSTMQFAGEMIRDAVGDEFLINASDAKLFALTAAAATLTAYGLCAAPAATILYVGLGAAGGAATGAAYSIAGQLDHGASLSTLDWGQVGSAALKGGIMGGLAGGAFAGAAAMIPGFCTVAQVGGLVASANSLRNAYNNFNEGNGYTAALDATLGLAGLYSTGRGLFGKMSEAANGSCFVAGTLVVRYFATSSQVAAIDVWHSESDNRWTSANMVLAAGVLGVGAFGHGTLSRHRDQEERRRQEEEARRLLFGTGNGGERQPWDDPWDRPNVEENVGGALRVPDDLWSDRIDQLCDALFNGVNEDRDMLLPAKIRCTSAAGRTSAAKLPANAMCVTSPHLRGEGQGEGCSVRRNVGLLSRLRSRFGRFLATACLLIGFVCLYKNVPAGDEQTTMPPVAAVAGPRYVTSNIEDLQVGDWVLARNPEISDEQRAEAEGADGEAEAGQWRTVSLRMTKGDGGRLSVTLLRPVEWLEECSAKPGKTIDLDLPELGAAGPAEVVSIDPCAEIDVAPSADCQLVTGTFAHESAEVIDLSVEGLDAPIGVTANHPFWSEDRHSFVPAGQLKVGERLASANGTFKRVVSLASRAGGQPVYNLEVNFEHAYYVSPAGVLVHNGCAGPPKAKAPVYAARRVGNRVVRGKTLSNKQAISRLKRGQDIFTPSKGKARWLQDKASGGNIGDRPHGDDFLPHYHGRGRDSGHAFYPPSHPGD